MREPLIKPKVFISHSKKDIEFIDKIVHDLRYCFIDTWFDEIDIRHGESWLNEIFENGLPACDAVLVYISESALSSPMVMKEIDAGILQKLKDNKVGFLPYINDSALRTQLRSDLESLQILEWNEKNYTSVLPRVVAAIWRSYMAMAIPNAIKTEKLKRVEAELELEKIKSSSSGSIFSQDENVEFEYLSEIYDRSTNLNFTARIRNASMRLNTQEQEQIKLPIEFCYVVNILDALMNFTSVGYSDHSFWSDVSSYIFKYSADCTGRYRDYGICSSKAESLRNELLTHGLLNRDMVESGAITSSLYKFSSKFDRFKYWMHVNGKIRSEIIFEGGIV